MRALRLPSPREQVERTAPLDLRPPTAVRKPKRAITAPWVLDGKETIVNHACRYLH